MIKVFTDTIGYSMILFGITINTLPHNYVFGILSCWMIIYGIDYRINTLIKEKQ